MLTRRAFLRASALVSAGIIAHNQLELLDRLAPRSLFPSSYVPRLWGDGIHDDTEALQRMMQAAVDSRHSVVSLPRGTYRLTRTIQIHGRVALPKTIDMGGSWLKGDQGVDPMVFITMP